MLAFILDGYLKDLKMLAISGDGFHVVINNNQIRVAAEYTNFTTMASSDGLFGADEFGMWPPLHAYMVQYIFQCVNRSINQGHTIVSSDADTNTDI